MRMSALSFDVLVIGGGPAGLAAAKACLRSDASVALIDDNPRIGGQIWRHGPGARPPAKAETYLQGVSNGQIRLLTGTRIVAQSGPSSLLVEDAQGSRVLHYRTLILCCGAREHVLPFPGWTLPGVTGAGALQALIKNGTSVRGERIVLAGSGPLLLASTASARSAGGDICGTFEQATFGSVLRFALGLGRWPGKVVQALSLSQLNYRTDSFVVEAVGKIRLEAVKVNVAGRLKEIKCERLACGFGLVPNTVVAQHLGCEIRERAVGVDELQGTSVAGIYAAGECTGIGGSELALIEGEIAGMAATGQTQDLRGLFAARARWSKFARAVERTFALREPVRQLARPDTLVCRCEDVPFSAVRDKTSWTEAKLHTRLGMGACQGRLCGTAACTLFGWDPPSPRPPLVPTRIETLLLDDH